MKYQYTSFSGLVFNEELGVCDFVWQTKPPCGTYEGGSGEPDF